MSKKIKKLRKKAEAEFDQPTYIDYKVRYVEDRELAEVCVNRNHTLADYLVMGSFALAKALRGETGDLLVYNMAEEQKETVRVFKGKNLYDVEMRSELFIQVVEPIEEVFGALHKGAPKVAGFGLAVFMAMLTHFSGVNPFPDEVQEDLKFENFENIIGAEMDIFFFIKKFYAECIKGIFYEM